MSEKELERVRWRETRLRLDALNLDPRFQPRVSLNEHTISRYRAAMLRGDPLPPIMVARVGNELHVVDGFHRVEAARAAGYDDIAAKVGRMPERLAITYAIQANAIHGLALSYKDKRKCFAMYIEAGNHLTSDGTVKSLRTIRRDLANIAWPTTISKWLRLAGVEPSEDDGPVVSWRDDEDEEGTDTSVEVEEIQSLLRSAEDLYQRLETDADRLAVRSALRSFAGRLERADAMLDV